MQIGFFFSIFPIVGIPVSIMLRYIPIKIERRLILILNFALSCLAYLCVGPSELIHLPDTLTIMAIGQVLAGLTYTTGVCLSLPEMADGVMKQFPGQEREVNNLSSAICLLANGIGQFLGPMTGSLLEEKIGFKHTTTVTAFINLMFSIVYFFCAGGF